MASNETVTKALALLRAGDWEGAHGLVQSAASAEAAWLHAHLHRVEGDLANARYWYRRAGRPEETGSLESEMAALTEALV